MMGEAYGFTSPVKTFAKTLYLEISLKAGDSYPLPDFVEQAAFYTVTGSVALGKRHSPERMMVGEAHMGIYNPGDDVVLTAHEDTRLVVIGGEKLTQRYIYWNFVSSSEARIEQARQDWRAKKFPTVPGDEIEFIPLPD
jgi:redox-sensitive bicupin YhaK (pirin superfamily)